MATAKKGSGRTGFLFIDKDPAIYVFLHAMELSGKTYAKIAEESNGQVAEGTIRNWDSGSTKRPQNRTLVGAMHGAGFRQLWVNGSVSIEPFYSGDRSSSERPFVVHKKA